MTNSTLQPSIQVQYKYSVQFWNLENYTYRFFKGYFSMGMNEDFYNSLNFPNVPPHELKLKVGMECYVVRNLSPEDGLLNNTPIRIIKISKYFLMVELISSNKCSHFHV